MPRDLDLESTPPGQRDVDFFFFFFGGGGGGGCFFFAPIKFQVPNKEESSPKHKLYLVKLI